jgi:methionyl-tRNA formyltransferase
MKRIVILTGNELRHQFFRKRIALTEGIEVVQSFCETAQQLIAEEVTEENILRHQHLQARLQSEKDFFELFVNTAEDKSNAVVIERGSINDQKNTDTIAALNVDLIVVYGASILKQPLLQLFPDKIVNIHLGLSPYYRGSATNYWPLVDMLPECVGATFMYIDEGIDTGEIIHQIRATYNYFDTPSSIGNRLIKEMTDVFAELIIQSDSLQKPAITEFGSLRKLCRNKNYTEESVLKLYQNFSNKMIDDYLANQTKRDAQFPILQNPLLV